MGTKKAAIRIPEKQIMRDCKAFLDFCKSRGYLTWRRISTTGVPINRAGQMFMMASSMTGMADLMVFLAKEYGSHTLHVEVKSSDGRLSQGQKAWRDELSSVGHTHYYVVNSEDQLLALLLKFGLPVKPILFLDP